MAATTFFIRPAGLATDFEVKDFNRKIGFPADADGLRRAQAFPKLLRCAM